MTERAVKRRHWAWWLAIGFAAFLLFSGVMTFAIMTAMKNSDAYRTAVAALNADAGIEKAIGHPIEAGWATGSINTSNADGHARLFFAAEGPRGKSHVAVALRRQSGVWRVETGQFVVEGTREQITFGSQPAASVRER